MTDNVIRIRGARQNNLQEPRPRSAAERAHRRDRRERLGQVVARVRHGVRRRPAPLRRDVLAVRAPVPRPHGQAAGRPHRRHPARDRDRPDEPRAHVALDRRHDDRAQRSREAAVRARRGAVLPQLRPRGAPRRRRVDLPRARSASRASAARARACSSRSRSDVPKNFSREEVETFLARAGLHAHSCAHARAASRSSKTASRSSAENRSRVVEALETALKLGNGQVTRAARRRTGRNAPFKFSAHRHCAHCDLSYAEPVPNSFSFNSPVGACEHLPRLRPHDRHRLPARDSGRGEDARAGRDQAVADEEQQGVPGRSAALRARARRADRRAVARASRPSSARG